jgi:hypothetical protein
MRRGIMYKVRRTMNVSTGAPSLLDPGARLGSRAPGVCLLS